MAAPRPASTRSETDLRVDRIGADGDGVATLTSGDPVYLPFTLPGETVDAPVLIRRATGWSGDAIVRQASPERAEPPCPHFGVCGGCTLQHWQDAPYAAWKVAQVQAALARAGFTDVPMAPLARTPPGGRRRVDLALARDNGRLQIGLHPRRDMAVVDLEVCYVLAPPLVALIGALRRVLPGISGLRRTGSAVANLLDNGIDLLLRTDASLSATDRVALTRLAEESGASRVSWALNAGPPEPACTRDRTMTMLAGAEVSPPPGAFLQASAEGAAAITAAVMAGLPEKMTGKSRIIELFAGCGTLTFALSERARVVAYEGDAPSADALRRATSGRRIEAVTRDLARQPLSTKEFAGAVAVVLDPPYAGAAAQMPGIAASGVERVIYVSCNPVALARDAQMLWDAGYAPIVVTPVDQFLWSAQVESVTVFAKAARRR